MKLYYFESENGNVGDDLNPWLWPKILGERLDEDEQHLLVGIGTLLNHRIPARKKYTVLTSGLGYGSYPKQLEGKSSYIGVRGPLTKERLNITRNICLLDGAYLMPNYLSPASELPKCSTGYIPHVDSIECGLWEEVCQLAGIKLLDPRWSVEKFINELCSCDRVVTEAMHGAILADAYGVPWQPVKAYSFINEFKWQDWGQSLNLDIVFKDIPPTWKGDRGLSFSSKAKNNIKRMASAIGMQSANWTKAPVKESKLFEIENTAKKLAFISENSEYQLSNRHLLQTNVEYLMESIEKIR